MTKSELENLLRRAGKLARDLDLFLIGSQSLRGVSKTIPSDFPKTIEVRDKDQQFVGAMLRHGFVKPPILLSRIEELPVPAVRQDELKILVNSLSAIPIPQKVPKRK